MTTEYIKLILDILILAGLGGFIFYALQLSRALNAFRAHRNEFDGIMRNLSEHIDTAQSAVKELKETSKISGDDLHSLIRDAKSLKEELNLINEAGNNLASRLELAAENSGRKAEAAANYSDNISSISKGRSAPRANKDDGFMIQDADFEEEYLGDFEDDDPQMNNLSSAAEKELYKALKKNKK